MNGTLLEFSSRKWHHLAHLLLSWIDNATSFMAKFRQDNDALYIGSCSNDPNVTDGTNMVAVTFDKIMELVMQETSILRLVKISPLKFDLMDPLEMNIVAIPFHGWVAANNLCFSRCLLYSIFEISFENRV